MQVAPGIPSFLDLPYEIREAVYGALLESDEPIPKVIPIRRTGNPVVRPQLTTAAMLRCNRQVHDELKATIRLWKKTGRTKYVIHSSFNRHGEPARYWKRLTVPLDQVQTLQLDICEHAARAFYKRSLPSDIYKLIFNFWEYGPELNAPHKAKWPLVDTVLINIQSTQDKLPPAQEIQLDHPREASNLSGLLQSVITDMLDSYYFDELRNYLGHYMRVMRIRCEGYVFERMVESDDTVATNEET